jgi:hypothetical protein
MDRVSLLEAKQLVEETLPMAETHKGALYELLAYIKRDLGVLGEGEYQELLLESIKFEPKWVVNRLSLAHSYQSEKKHDLAIDQLEAARENVLYWQHIVLTYEALITGRNAGKERSQEIGRQIAALKAKK